jgi:hypothetical protein
MHLISTASGVIPLEIYNCRSEGRFVVYKTFEPADVVGLSCDDARRIPRCLQTKTVSLIVEAAGIFKTYWDPKFMQNGKGRCGINLLLLVLGNAIRFSFGKYSVSLEYAVLGTNSFAGEQTRRRSNGERFESRRLDNISIG